MRRLGLFTGSGVIGAALVPLLVVVAAFAGGGKIFSSGPLNADQGAVSIGGAWSHADLACNACHAPFWSADRMGDRCLDCHTDIAGQLANPTSLHAGIASPDTCRTCHPEHRGSHGPLTLYAPDLYPHAEFGFYLLSHLKRADDRPFTCRDCHTDPTQAFSQDTCISCHEGLDSTRMATHELDFGSNCLACHDGIDSFGKRFDHQATAFPLEGLHVNLACSKCHAGMGNLDQLRATPTDCVACHAAADAHKGSLGTDCSGCHTPADWGTAKLDHGLTAFPLVGRHVDLACEKCHVGGKLKGIPTLCLDCHRTEDKHAGKFGTDCGTCHTPENWSTIIDGNFDHGLTGFSLTGAHARVAACTDCHRGGRFAGTPTSCVGCHSADDAHKGAYGASCSNCHGVNAWKPANFDHGQTGFKLSGGHAGLDCARCHPGQRFQGTPTTCVACHATKDAHNGAFGKDCGSCHSTNAWKPANFDHSGKTDCASCHANVKPANHYAGQCSQCHNTSAWKPATFNHTGLTDCASCHAGVRPANHSSGQCSTCHTTNAWKPATFDHTGKTDCASCHANVKPANHYAGQCSACHSTTAWKPATFNHTGLTDCASCHTNVKPANHFAGQCSQCHTTSAWTPATFNHPSSPLALTGQHAVPPRTCSNCHASSTYANVATTCDGCHHSTYVGVTNPNHTAAGMSAFAAANCASCHSSARSDWAGATWTHMRITNPQPIGLPHEGATCAKCHQNAADYTIKSCAGSGCHQSANGPN